MLILTTPTFDNTRKKFPKNQKIALDKAIETLAKNPLAGEAKKGNLKGVYVYKFKVLDKQYLLAYEILARNEIKLLMLGVHENFYRTIKK